MGAARHLHVCGVHLQRTRVDFDRDHQHRAVAEPGTEVTVLWGEPDGGAAKSSVETHVQIPIRAIVVPSPHSDRAREHYSPYTFAAA